jgi:UDP-glucose 4-epimerase
VTGRAVASVAAPRRPGDPARLVADVRKARDRLGFTAERTLEDIVRSAWAWHERNPHGYGPGQ